MRTLRAHRLVLACLTVVGLSAFLASCGGSGGGMMSGSGGTVQIQISTSDGEALLSEIPAEALATRSTGGVTALDGSGGSGDTPRPALQAFEVTFASIAALDPDGVEVPVTIALPATIDLVSLAGGRTVELPIGFLPPGTYQGFVVTISAVVLVLEDGTRITIEPPGEGWTARIRTAPFEVVDGQPTTVELRLRLRQALRFLRGHFVFDPIFDCSVGGRGDDRSDDDSD